MALFRRWRAGLGVAGIHPLALLRSWRAGGGRNTPLDPPEEMEGLGLEEHTLRPYSGDGGLGGGEEYTPWPSSGDGGLGVEGTHP